MAEQKLNIEDDVTPLQAKLETIADQIGGVGVAVSIVTFLVVTCKLITLKTLNLLVNYLILSITVVVVAVPEGLPLAVTISLAYSVMKMKLENNLVRRLDASETMGGANEICTDKTGTLTKNQMTVKAFYLDHKSTSNLATYRECKTSEIMNQGVLFNCSARIEIKDGQYQPMGNCTE